MFRKFMLFSLGACALAGALAYVTRASTIAYEPAFERVISSYDSGPLTYGYDLANATFKAVRDIEARATVGGGRHAPSTLNKAISPNILSAAIAPTSVSGWRSGRVRTLAG